jgi:hypothetical protein
LLTFVNFCLVGNELFTLTSSSSVTVVVEDHSPEIAPGRKV